MPTWEERYWELERHHREETAQLRAEIDRLRSPIVGRSQLFSESSQFGFVSETGIICGHSSDYDARMSPGCTCLGFVNYWRFRPDALEAQLKEWEKTDPEIRDRVRLKFEQYDRVVNRDFVLYNS